MDNKRKKSPEKEQSNEQKISTPATIGHAIGLVYRYIKQQGLEDLGLISDPDTGEG